MEERRVALGKICSCEPGIQFSYSSVRLGQGGLRIGNSGNLLAFGRDEVFAECDTGRVCLVEGEEV